ncbi:MAG: serine/threonine protein kinase [Myxococcaceae bacterium]|nr:serine/threonine protein kinase [Myxococcaceae bacterium]MEA2747460.1 eukaryotic-like serine/threonine-protein kinase [Myxococcales bacterium]
MARSDGQAHPRIVGRYVLYGELASGGMATVHFGRLSGPVGFSRTVAIKRLHPQYAKDPEFVTMFLDEARLCGRIRHPNVVPTLDVVATEGEIFIVMEYVAGEALSKLMKTAWAKNIPVPPRVAATIISSVLHGLHSAHQTKDEHGRELGIVHRDVSPQNILVGSDGTSRVLDFGVAKAAGRIQTTRDGQVKGKIAYMPPEQLSGGLVSRQSDIYAASVVLWEALTGRRLFDGETEAIVLVRAIEGKVDPPSMFNPQLDRATDEVVMRGLAREPSARFATARDMALAIEQTVGLASPYEVGEWVESVAAEEIGRRARNIAEIESASMNTGMDRASAPRIGLSPQPAEPPHSQVSSISVSRPAISTPAPASLKSRRATRAFGIVAGLLAIAGLVLGGLALQDSLSGAHTGAANEVARDTRAIAILKPQTSPTKGGGSGSTGSTAAAADAPKVTSSRPLAAPAPPVAAPKPPKTNAACDPPYTIDPATGRKKYKLECLK